MSKRRAASALAMVGVIGVAGFTFVRASDAPTTSVEDRAMLPDAAAAPTILTPALVQAATQSLSTNPVVATVFGEQFDVISTAPVTDGSNSLVGVAFTVTTEHEIALPAGIPTYAAQSDADRSPTLTVTTKPARSASQFVIQMGLDNEVIAFLVVPDSLVHEG